MPQLSRQNSAFSVCEAKTVYFSAQMSKNLHNYWVSLIKPLNQSCPNDQPTRKNRSIRNALLAACEKRCSLRETTQQRLDPQPVTKTRNVATTGATAIGGSYARGVFAAWPGLFGAASVGGGGNGVQGLGFCQLARPVRHAVDCDHCFEQIANFHRGLGVFLLQPTGGGLRHV